MLDTDRESLGGIHLDHPPQEVLAVWRNKMGHMKNPQLHFLQQVPQVIIIKWQSTLIIRETQKHVFTSQILEDMYNSGLDPNTPRYKIHIKDICGGCQTTKNRLAKKDDCSSIISFILFQIHFIIFTSERPIRVPDTTEMSALDE